MPDAKRGDGMRTSMRGMRAGALCSTRRSTCHRHASRDFQPAGRTSARCRSAEVKCMLQGRSSAPPPSLSVAKGPGRHAGKGGSACREEEPTKTKARPAPPELPTRPRLDETATRPC
eukprot:6621856-Prymnesium_polylepis.1